MHSSISRIRGAAIGISSRAILSLVDPFRTAEVRIDTNDQFVIREASSDVDDSILSIMQKSEQQERERKQGSEGGDKKQEKQEEEDEEKERERKRQRSNTNKTLIEHVFYLNESAKYRRVDKSTYRMKTIATSVGKDTIK